MRSACTIAIIAISSGMLMAAPGSAQNKPIARIEEVVSQPAFQRPHGKTERVATQGQPLQNRTVLRTAKPGRMQIQMNQGNRSFRMGGNASLQINGNTINHRSGQIIAWIAPGGPRVTPLQIRTRIATAAIRGTTLFIDDQGDKIIFLSWEGDVSVQADSGEAFSLNGGQVLTYDDSTTTWSGPLPLTRKQAMTRRRKSQLLNGFQAPMQTMPEVEAVLNQAPSTADP